MRRMIIGLATVHLSLGIVTGCRPPEQPAATPIPLPAVDLSTPEAATRTLMLTLKAQLDAGARRDRNTVRSAAELLSGRIAAEDRIVNRLSVGALAGAARATMVKMVTRNWGGLVSHYAEQFELDGMRRGRSGPDEVVMLVRARGRTDSAWLKIDCVKVESEWRIWRIDFLHGEPTSRPVASSQP